MRRITGVLTSAAVLVVLGAATALAQTYPPTSPPPPTTSVLVDRGGPGPTAFTGSDITLGVIAIGVLLAVGLGALFMARRRSSRVAG
jgi:hypothetical protein